MLSYPTGEAPRGLPYLIRSLARGARIVGLIIGDARSANVWHAPVTSKARRVSKKCQDDPSAVVVSPQSYYVRPPSPGQPSDSWLGVLCPEGTQRGSTLAQFLASPANPPQHTGMDPAQILWGRQFRGRKSVSVGYVCRRVMG